MFVFWLVAAIVLAVAEALTSTLITIWFMFGAILAMKKATVDSRLLCPTVFLIINRSF